MLVAPELDCYPLREVHRFARGSWNETFVVSVKVGEPERSLFEVPEHFVEKSPVEINELHSKKFGVEYFPKAQLPEVEARYQRLKRPGVR